MRYYIEHKKGNKRTKFCGDAKEVPIGQKITLGYMRFNNKGTIEPFGYVSTDFLNTWGIKSFKHYIHMGDGVLKYYSWSNI
jgi:hypothetical protein